MTENWIEQLAVILVFIIFFIDKTSNSLNGFINMGIPPDSQTNSHRIWKRYKRNMFIQISAGVIFELTILIILFGEIISILSNSTFSLIGINTAWSLKIILYVCIFGLLNFSGSMLKTLFSIKRIKPKR